MRLVLGAPQYFADRFAIPEETPVAPLGAAEEAALASERREEEAR